MFLQAGIDKSEEILNEFQTSNNIELITSAYFDAEDCKFSTVVILSKTKEIKYYP